MVKNIFQFFVTFIFNNHIVQNHTTHHDVSDYTHVPLPMKVLYDSKVRLQNPKTSFNIFSCTLLH
jgi:hypothetical protein